MGERELRDKYVGKLDKAINRAIRAEIPAGNAALDLLAKISGPAASSGWTDRDGNSTPEAALYLKHRRSVVGPLIAKICRAYKITHDEPAKKKPAARRRKPKPKPRPR